MKIVLFGDVHGKSLDDISSFICDYKPTDVMCTADFDTVQTLNQWRNLENKLLNNDINTHIVPGNHDRVIYYNHYLESTWIDKLGKSIYELHQELKEDNVAHEYMKRLMNPHKFMKKIAYDNSQLLLIHGALGGSMYGYEDAPMKIWPLWMRLNNSREYEDNFSRMKEKGIQLMLRGHDHKASHATLQENNTSYEEKPKFQSEFILNTSQMHVINPGAYCKDKFATLEINNETILLNYRNIK